MADDLERVKCVEEHSARGTEAPCRRGGVRWILRFGPEVSVLSWVACAQFQVDICPSMVRRPKVSSATEDMCVNRRASSD